MKFSVGLVLATIAVTTVHAGNSFTQKGLSSESASDSTSSSVDSSEVSDLDTSCSYGCLAVMRPVTDENGVTYSNECYMEMAKCKGKKKDVDVLEEYKRLYGNSFGASRDGSAGAESANEEGGSYEDDSGSEESGSSSAATKLVKSSEGPSKATKSRKTSSASASGIGSLYEDGSEGVIEDESSTPSTKCAQGCPDVALPVCGSDGVKYSNPCELKIAACKNPELNIVEDYTACTSSKVTTQDETAVKKSGKIGTKLV